MNNFNTILRALVLCFMSTAASAQIYVDTTANWQQYIPNLMGGDCVQISNVSVNAAPGAVALFQDTSGLLGLPQGLLMTSGNAFLATGPNDSGSDGVSNGHPGDSLLQVYAGQLASSYDAAVIEFDFTSPIDDTVFVDYIFGSEEYLEFVGTSFNDIFGFFVSTPGLNNAQNIALVPGTQLPVAINNVNQNLNTQYFVDNTDPWAPTLNYLEYDGLTTPLTAVFFAQAGQTYHLKIAISDIGDGVFDSGVFLRIQTSNQTLSGTISHQGAPATAGTVEVFGYNVNGGVAPLIASSPIDVNGQYQFNGLPAGAYVIRTTLDTLLYPGTFPMYFDSVMLWDDASIVVLPCNNGPLDIDARQAPAAGGPGEVFGMVDVMNAVLLQRNPLGPAEGVNIFLVNSLDGSIQAYTRTDANGQFRFSGVPFGTYEVMPDVPGLNVLSTHAFDLTPNDLSYTLANYLIDELSIQALFPVGTQQPETLPLSLFPNPVDNGQLNLVTEAEAQFMLIDAQGRVVMQAAAAGAGMHRLDVSGLPGGLYWLTARNSTQFSSVKVLIHNP